MNNLKWEIIYLKIFRRFKIYLKLILKDILFLYIMYCCVINNLRLNIC